MSTLCVVGGGVVGLGAAGALAEDYDRVVLLERRDYCYRGSSYAAGGMLAPFMEVEFREREVLEFNVRSLRRYESFLETLREESEVPIKLGTRGSLYVALDDQHLKELERLHEFQERLDLPVRRLSASQVRDHEPLIGKQVREGLLAPQEKYVNNRRLGLALYRRCQRKGVTVLTGQPVKDMRYHKNGYRIKALRTPDQSILVDDVLVAAGARSGQLPGLKPADRMPVRPVKGQAVSVRPGDSFQPGRIVRSPDFYGVPHPGERFLVGATMEERGFETHSKAGHVLRLLEAARRVLPDLSNRPFQEFWSGLRPASRDNRPVLGPSPATENLYFATGNYRNGILQLPMVVEALRGYLTEAPLPGNLEPFHPGRFRNNQKKTDTTNLSTPEGGVIDA